MPVPARKASDYRLFEEAGDVIRLQFVRWAKALGFTLSELHELLALSGRWQADMAGLRASAAGKLVDMGPPQATAASIRHMKLRNPAFDRYPTRP